MRVKVIKKTVIDGILREQGEILLLEKQLAQALIDQGLVVEV